MLTLEPIKGTADAFHVVGDLPPGYSAMIRRAPLSDDPVDAWCFMCDTGRSNVRINRHATPELALKALEQLLADKQI
jgi:hypothetical protein